MNLGKLHPAEQIVQMMNRIYGRGMTTTSGGNLSVMDDDGTVWITPAGIDKGSLTAEDIIQIKPDGAITGRHKPSCEYPSHLSVYEQRPDIKAVVHAHTPALVAFGITGKIPDISMFPASKLICKDVAMVDYATPGSVKLGEFLADRFKEGYNTVMLKNHGAITGGADLTQAFGLLETLDVCAQIEVLAKSLGHKPMSLAQAQTAEHEKIYDLYKYEYIGQTPSYDKNKVYCEILSLIRRAYQKKLFTRSLGIFSQRIDKNSFIISAGSIDNEDPTAEDLVYVKTGSPGCNYIYGKIPSRYAGLHSEIYRQSVDIHSIVTANPPNIMAFTVSGLEFDARLIPESYMMLRDVRTVPFAEGADTLARGFKSDNPVCIIKNECAVVCGSSPINAFDRIEVLECNAAAVISAVKLGGGIAKIDSSGIEDIKTTFGLL